MNDNRLIDFAIFLFDRRPYPSQKLVNETGASLVSHVGGDGGVVIINSLRTHVYNNVHRYA